MVESIENYRVETIDNYKRPRTFTGIHPRNLEAFINRRLSEGSTIVRIQSITTTTKIDTKVADVPLSDFVLPKATEKKKPKVKKTTTYEVWSESAGGQPQRSCIRTTKEAAEDYRRKAQEVYREDVRAHAKTYTTSRLPSRKYYVVKVTTKQEKI